MLADPYSPCLTTSSMLDPVSCAMKPIIEKMANPAKILVPQFNSGIIRASLKTHIHMNVYTHTHTLMYLLFNYVSTLPVAVVIKLVIARESD